MVSVVPFLGEAKRLAGGLNKLSFSIMGFCGASSAFLGGLNSDPEPELFYPKRLPDSWLPNKEPVFGFSGFSRAILGTSARFY